MSTVKFEIVCNECKQEDGWILPNGSNRIKIICLNCKCEQVVRL